MVNIINKEDFSDAGVVACDSLDQTSAVAQYSISHIFRENVAVVVSLGADQHDGGAWGGTEDILKMNSYSGVEFSYVEARTN